MIDASMFPERPTFALYRYVDEAHRIEQVYARLWASLKPFVESFDSYQSHYQHVNIVMRMMDEMTFQRVIDNFQTYIVDLLAEIFSSRPEMIPSGQIDRRAIFQENISEQRIMALDQLLRGFSYESIESLSDKLQKLFKFYIFESDDELVRLKSYVEIRNALVHNRGRADYRYRVDFNSGGRKQGTPVSIPEVMPVLEDVSRMAAYMDVTAEQKFGLEKVSSKDD
jgi:hypothetical protein